MPNNAASCDDEVERSTSLLLHRSCYTTLMSATDSSPPPLGSLIAGGAPNCLCQVSSLSYHRRHYPDFLIDISSSRLLFPLQQLIAQTMRKSVSRKVQVSQPYATPRLGLSNVRTMRQSDIAHDREGIGTRYRQQTASKEN
jgi:hypothetical protein